MAGVIQDKVQQSHVEIREFKDRDYESKVEIENLNFPDQRGTVEEARYDDEHFDRTKYFDRRYVAEDPSTGRVVAHAHFNHMACNFHPDKYGMWIAIHPKWQRRGMGRFMSR